MVIAMSIHPMNALGTFALGFMVFMLFALVGALDNAYSIHDGGLEDKIGTYGCLTVLAAIGTATVVGTIGVLFGFF